MSEEERRILSHQLDRLERILIRCAEEGKAERKKRSAERRKKIQEERRRAADQSGDSAKR